MHRVILMRNITCKNSLWLV